MNWLITGLVLWLVAGFFVAVLVGRFIAYGTGSDLTSHVADCRCRDCTRSYFP